MATPYFSERNPTELLAKGAAAYPPNGDAPVDIAEVRLDSHATDQPEVE